MENSRTLDGRLYYFSFPINFPLKSFTILTLPDISLLINAFIVLRVIDNYCEITVKPSSPKIFL